MIKKITLLCTLALASIAVSNANADTLDMSGGKTIGAIDAPQRGMSMQRVESKWGQPTRRKAAVGQPPITRWEYDGFVVYFEFDKVIHSVAKPG
ncbi:MAG: hypothetical protein AB8F65_06950 [Woeseiaceae bacterium]